MTAARFNGPFRYNGGGVPPYMTGRSKDGHWIQFGNLTPQTLFNFLQQLGLDWTLQDERYANQPVFAKGDDLRELQRLCLAALLEKERDEWMRIFMENDIAASPSAPRKKGCGIPKRFTTQRDRPPRSRRGRDQKQLGVSWPSSARLRWRPAARPHGSAPTPPPFSPASTTPRPPHRGPPRPRRSRSKACRSSNSPLTSPAPTPPLSSPTLAPASSRSSLSPATLYRVMSFPACARPCR